MEISKVFLFVTEGSLQRRRYTLDKSARCVIGRAEDCEIRVDPGRGAGAVSPHHCVIEVAPAEVIITDLGSHTGTFVNGQKLELQGTENRVNEPRAPTDAWRTLEAGDLVRVGHVLIRIAVCRTDQSTEESAHSASVLWL